MTDADNVLDSISPASVLEEIARAVPSDCRENMVIIGSLAVGYHYFSDRPEMAVRTKDVDTLLSPRRRAVPAGVAITERLCDEGWEIRDDHGWGAGDENTPDENLSAVRLRPRGSTGWFIELLTVPESQDDTGRRWLRIATRYGHFGLCSFRFLALADYDPAPTPMGIGVARPEMLALANLLEHPTIKPEVMAAGFAGRAEIKRSNKDLGRAVAISWLASDRDEDALLKWPVSWMDALRRRFPDESHQLAARVGDGLTALLASDVDLDQAYYTCVNGLLASRPPTLEQFQIAGERLLADAIRPLAEEARR